MPRFRHAALVAFVVAGLVPGTAGAAPATNGYVDVAVATVWTDPTSPRPVDAKALTNPVDVPGWLADMTPDQQEGLTDGNLTQTQARYGQRVVITGGRGGWYEVAVPGQPNPKNAAAGALFSVGVHRFRGVPQPLTTTGAFFRFRP